MSLRLLGGTFKGRMIKSPKGALSKPTMSIMRKSVFDILQTAVEDASFLDVFACSGAMGLEALSRGALKSTFIDKDKLSIKCIQENLRLLNVEDKGDVFCGDALAMLKKLHEKKRTYSIVYIDPPYTHIQEPTISPITLLSYLEESSLLEPGAIVFVEEGYPSLTHIDTHTFSKLRLKNSRKFSSSLLHQFHYSL